MPLCTEGFGHAIVGNRASMPLSGENGLCEAASKQRNNQQCWSRSDQKGLLLDDFKGSSVIQAICELVML